MKDRAWTSAGIAGVLLLSACGTEGGATTGGAGGSGAGGSSETGTGGALPQPTPPEAGPPAFVVGGFAVQLPEVTAQPGEELYPCWIAPLELDGASRVVGGASMTVAGGMHHGNVTARPKTGDGLRPCPDDTDLLAGEAGDVLAGGAVLFGSTTQFEGTEWRTFPEGMGYPIGEDWEIVFRMHYLNTTPEPVTVAPRYDWYTIDEASVTELLAPFIWMYTNFEIPPRSETTVGADCPLVTPAHFVSLMPHMHKLGTRFTARVNGGPHDGQLFLDSPGYNPDGVIVGFDPPLDMSDSLGFRFECTWVNTFDKTIEEGVGDNEMCMLFGYGYPYEAAMTAYAANASCATIAAPRPDGF